MLRHTFNAKKWLKQLDDRVGRYKVDKHLKDLVIGKVGDLITYQPYVKVYTKDNYHLISFYINNEFGERSLGYIHLPKDADLAESLHNLGSHLSEIKA